MIVYLSGRYLPASRARVSVFDRGLLYGDALFETVRVYGDQPFALESHWARMAGGAQRMGFRIPGDAALWSNIAATLVRRNGLTSAGAAVRFTVTRGPAGETLAPPRGAQPMLLATARALDPRLPRFRRRGVAVSILPFHSGLGGLLDGVKTTDYATAVLAKVEAARQGAFEGIYSTPRGELLEGATSNLFCVRRGKLLTPPLATGVLPGVTRSLVVELARELGIAVREKRLQRADLERADEAFLTATTLEVMPIRSVDGSSLGDPGLLTRRLQDAYCAGHAPAPCLPTRKVLREVTKIADSSRGGSRSNSMKSLAPR